ncbi:MAG: HD domain-containing protein [Candidatus Kuenenia stuttgartiensis]|jgi:putative two-component system response regulator|uniref:HD-GYP domain-containing protein n=1 Tax=Kuenenia stuttgartiensis TaxID=174633 RepID=A0A2C9CDP8_KUEST|nr:MULTISPECIES: HD domain-containing phosphohydrolase [Kuenenia]MBE7547131.1 HD domain-containing protein [Planctomycetia bacterium]MBZ0192955.1 HD domain-containing protein [Candidatus Kuenenia stuttgartiensis]MCL4727257.1 HD domain-containing protein [Candidatus Kuenenia stuttgartiensis]MCZ7621339.1 HD domain-containing protein [Candidatus Kuenenia sp.]SOH02847.1 hypothetical protein KSMBR1_0331 [Candidatus Kuenenia stuttgartiensis]
MLNRNVIKQNVMFLSITILLFILFGTVLYVGSSQIYEREAKWQHGKTTAQLVSGKKIIEEYFSWSAQNLLFLRDLPNTKDYADSDFESSHYKKIEEKIFRDFARVYKKYSQIKIIDASGHEIVRINKHQDDTTIIVPDSDLRDHRHHPHFQETMKLDKDQMCSSPIGVTIDQEKADGPCISVISFATPLFNSENEKNGILILDISFSEVLEVLPKNMFIQTEEGNIISLKQDGSVNFATSDYIFHDSSGWLYLSDVETIHYATVEFLPGKRFIVAMFHSHPLLKAGLQRLIWVSVLLLALFICLILVIGYINFSRFWALIEAQKAIIFSLVRLTEIRDQETGDHLERTRNYTIILARQLRKKKKYRKILKNEFLEDLYDAASLHDIGKVGIRDAILLKKTMLSDEEYKEMAEHPRIGKQVLQDAIDTFKLKQSFLILGRNICAYHHEKYNGKGYPEGLKGLQIPLEARIFAVCDVYDAMRSKRTYKEPLSHEETVKRIESDSGEHFDPDIVDAFLEIEKEFKGISVSENINIKVPKGFK